MLVLNINELHSEVIVTNVDIINKKVSFKNSDGIGMCAYESLEDWPTVEEITTAIQAVMPMPVGE
jgi:hypothetical protein